MEKLKNGAALTAMLLMVAGLSFALFKKIEQMDIPKKRECLLLFDRKVHLCELVSKTYGTHDAICDDGEFRSIVNYQVFKDCK